MDGCPSVRSMGAWRSLRENRGNIMEYYDLGSVLIDFLDLGQKIYQIPKMIRHKMMSWSVSSLFVLYFLG